MMNRWKFQHLLLFLILVCVGYFGYGGLPIALAEGVSPSFDPIEISIHLGTPQGNLKFEPNQLHLRMGQKYKLLLDNPSPVKHYFTARKFANNSWTQKVEAGNVEVKGAVNEVELRPGATAQWLLTPMKAGTYELHCSVTGHQQGGMIGEIQVAKE